jgi:modulator of FtsH protease
MASASTEIRSAPTQDRTRTLVGQTMGWIAATVGAFAVGAFVGRDLAYQWGLLFFIGSLGCLVALNRAVERSEPMTITLLLAFGGVTGLAVAPTLAYYVSTDPRTVWLAAGATGLLVAGFGTAGYATRRDLSDLGRALFWALLGLILFGIALIFVAIPDGALVYAVGGLVIFAGLVAFDFQRLRRNDDARTAPLLAASIFLDILNVFLLLLTFVGGGRE